MCWAVEQKPLVAHLNERIQTSAGEVIIEKVIVYPDEASLYGGPGEVNYGMPVEEEYGNGPVVILSVLKQPTLPPYSIFGTDWLKVELYSDGKRLSRRIGGEKSPRRLIYGFSFWVETGMDVSPEGGVELDELGDLDLVVTVSKVEKIFDVPLRSIPQGSKAIFEDENVQILEVRLRESVQHKTASLHVKIHSKTESAYYGLVYKGAGASHFESTGAITISYPVNNHDVAEFWKIVPLAQRKISSLKFTSSSEESGAEQNNIKDAFGEL